jgi:hypothetical protein
MMTEESKEMKKVKIKKIYNDDDYGSEIKKIKEKM